MCASGERAELGTLLSREDCEWPLWMRQSDQRDNGFGEKVEGKEGLIGQRLQGCRRGKPGRKACILGEWGERGLNRHNRWDIRVGFACVSPKHRGK